MYLTNAIEIIEEGVEINALYEFLKNCEGSVWQIEGTITNSQCDIRKGCISIAKVTHKNFQKDLILFVNDWLTKNAFAWNMRKSQKPGTNDIYNRITKSFKTNALLGLGAYQIFILSLNFINETNDFGWSKTKLYSFVYDIIKKCGKFIRKPIVEDGFKGSIGREKFIAVNNWITAFEKAIYTIPKLNT